MGFNCTGPLTGEFFSIVNTTVLQDVRLVESSDAEPWIKTANYKLYTDFRLHKGLEPLILSLLKGQL